MIAKHGFLIAVIFAVAFVFFVPVLPIEGTLSTLIIGTLVKGFRVGDASSPNPDAPDEIGQNPADLAASANLDLDTYTLARVISSEEGNNTPAYWVAIGWAMKNLANHYGAGIFDAATDGSFGRQSGGVSGRPVSTWVDPYDGHVAVAQAILSGGVPDPTNGAYQWVAPKAQDALNKRDPSKYKPFAQVNADRIAGGLKEVKASGVDASLLVFYA